MPCTEQDAASRASAKLRFIAAWLGLCALSACQTPPPIARAPSPAPAPPARATPAPAPTAPYTRPARTVDEYQRQIAARLMAANPKITYTARAPEILLAIPVLELEVNADGSVRHIGVMRTPTQATDTIQIAMDAIRRAAPRRGWACARSRRARRPRRRRCARRRRRPRPRRPRA